MAFYFDHEGSPADYDVSHGCRRARFSPAASSGLFQRRHEFRRPDTDSAIFVLNGRGYVEGNLQHFSGQKTDCERPGCADVQSETSFRCSSAHAPTAQPIRSAGTCRANRTIIWPEYAGVGHDCGFASGTLGFSRCHYARIDDEFAFGWEIEFFRGRDSRIVAEEL